MDSRRLSQRSVQPGHDQTFRASEESFITVASRCLDPERYEVEANPSDLRECFSPRADGGLGLNPEAAIRSIETEKVFFVEVKKQGPRGNAEERACKHHTFQFYKLMNDLYGYSHHPYVTVFCENLATDRRYTEKFKYLFEPDNYFLWVDYNEQALCEWLRARCSAWLDEG